MGAEEALVRSMREEVLKPVASHLRNETQQLPPANSESAGVRSAQPEAPPLGVKPTESRQLLDLSEQSPQYLSPVQSNPPSPRVEAARLRRVRALLTGFSSLVSSHIPKRKAHALFEQWLCDMRSRGCVPNGCVLPDGRNAETPGGPLRESMINVGASRQEANAVCREAGKMSARLAAKLRDSSTLEGRTRPKIRLSEKDIGGLRSNRKKARLALGSTAVELNREHFAKLFVLLRRFHPEDTNRDLKEKVFCVAARYASECGGQLKAAATQAALHPEVFECFKRWLGASVELFASPLNCRWAPFCSHHPDVDAPFGSLGDAFSFQLPHTISVQANPPFVESTVSKCALLIERMLSNAPHGATLSFAVVLPEWPNNTGWRRLTRSRFNYKTVKLEALKHGFLEGAQHTKREVHRPSCHASTVFVLQTEEGARKWPAVDEFVHELRNAFAPRHNSTIKRKRQSTEAPDDDKRQVSVPDDHRDHTKVKKKDRKRRKQQPAL